MFEQKDIGHAHRGQDLEVHKLLVGEVDCGVGVGVPSDTFRQLVNIKGWQEVVVGEKHQIGA